MNKFRLVFVLYCVWQRIVNPLFSAAIAAANIADYLCLIRVPLGDMGIDIHFLFFNYFNKKFEK